MAAEVQTKEELEASKNDLEANLEVILPKFKDPEEEKKDE